jgi:hypothetical protein
VSEDLDKVKEITYNNKSRLETHEALCTLRYEQILEKLNFCNSQIATLTAKLETISTLAVQGKTSISTTIWLLGAGAGAFTFFIFILKTFKVI